MHDESPPAEDPWDEHLDASRAHAVLDKLGPHHRAALTLRYLDGLSVPEVADHLGRGVHATEALLVRARIAFRRAYEGAGDDALIRWTTSAADQPVAPRREFTAELQPA